MEFSEVMDKLNRVHQMVFSESNDEEFGIRKVANKVLHGDKIKKLNDEKTKLQKDLRDAEYRATMAIAPLPQDTNENWTYEQAQSSGKLSSDHLRRFKAFLKAKQDKLNINNRLKEIDELLRNKYKQ